MNAQQIKAKFIKAQVLLKNQVIYDKALMN